ncbi:MAG: Patatin [Candidatus Methanoperedens sp.]|nr:Patatin [Candidatus Methanoperedens sp.]
MVKSVAIACQGGGSHTAFTAGVLKRILREENGDYEIGGLSGTSGGAICALLAWYGLLNNDKNKSIRLLDSFWRDIAANSFLDILLNDWIIWVSKFQGIIPMVNISPYDYPPWAQEHMRSILNKLVDFDDIGMLINESSPDLLVGAADVLSGKFKVFENSEINADAILASAAVPTFLRAIHIDGKVYWDGLFSQNPPVKNFIESAKIHEKPDEIWIIHINPQQRHYEPVSIKEIDDRRNELSGNISLYQELDFIENVNKWIGAGYLPGDRYKHIEIKWIGKLKENRDYESKLDRKPQFIQDMMNHGEQQAEEFLRQL